METYMTLIKPRPIPAFDDGVYGVDSYAEPISKRLLCYLRRIVCSANCSNVLLGEFCEAILRSLARFWGRLFAAKEPCFALRHLVYPVVLATSILQPFRVLLGPVVFTHRRQPCLQGVASVFLRRHVFKVGEAIINLLPVLVVNLDAVWTRANEGGGHKTVNRRFQSLCSAPKAYEKITIAPDRGLKQSSGIRSGDVFQSGGYPLNTSKIRNIVVGFEPDDWTPFFGLKFFDGKFCFSQGVNLQSGLALGRLVLETPSHARAVFILA